MMVKTVGLWGNCPVFITPSERFSIQQFANSHSFSEAPTIVLQGEVTFVYRFTLIRRSGDMVREWDNGRMEPFASLSDDDCKSLHEIADSDTKLDAREKMIVEILERNTFMHFGSGS